ncbi:outer membrane beta-barrel protein [Microscilla marina]|uniref:Outer membrane protein beta-barrel domain-containing protein n=1 Tax=Microscilla marina ATCC 23134 TaxID=313606 RepID=A1ZGN8_MICM2|nr:outer membrane beta-barrel protein [Microscilla marina]EAY30655.1 hypothetical protein M23134_03293 [Microscilla marina ATCC 23134]
MKKLTLLVVLIFVALNLQAQNNHYAKGRWMLGGNIAFVNATFENTINGVTTSSTQNVFNISPQVGYFITPGFALTLNTDFNFSNVANTVSLQPGVRGYVVKDLFLAGRVGWGQTNVKDSNTEVSNFNWQVGVGYSFFLAPNVALEPGLYYQYTRDTNSVSSSENVSRVINLGLGLRVFL